MGGGVKPLVLHRLWMVQYIHTVQMERAEYIQQGGSTVQQTYNKHQQEHQEYQEYHEHGVWLTGLSNIVLCNTLHSSILLYCILLHLGGPQRLEYRDNSLIVTRLDTRQYYIHCTVCILLLLLLLLLLG